MNKFIQAVKDLEINAIKALLQKDPKWIGWVEDDGKNALHYLCAVNIASNLQKADTSLQILKFLLKSGMDINAIHQIKDGCGFFPATPLWYAYTRGRNELLYHYLLDNGADPEHCMFAIAWYDDTKAADLFKAHGANINDGSIGETPFLAAFNWKRFPVAEWFLQNGADVNFADKKGNTALYYAVKKKYQIEQIQLLLKFGADWNKENDKGISAKKLAELNRQRKILGLIPT
jgi:hypothetical protein